MRVIFPKAYPVMRFGVYKPKPTQELLGFIDWDDQFANEHKRKSLEDYASVLRAGADVRELNPVDQFVLIRKAFDVQDLPFIKLMVRQGLNVFVRDEGETLMSVADSHTGGPGGLDESIIRFLINTAKEQAQSEEQRCAFINSFSIYTVVRFCSLRLLQKFMDAGYILSPDDKEAFDYAKNHNPKAFKLLSKHLDPDLLDKPLQ